MEDVRGQLSSARIKEHKNYANLKDTISKDAKGCYSVPSVGDRLYGRP